MKRKYFLLLPVIFCCLFAHAQTQVNDSSITVQRENMPPVKLQKKDMAIFRRVSTEMTDRDGKVHRYAGIAVSDILQKAGLAMGKQLHGENLAQYMLAKAGDGYTVAFSLAELDSSFAEKTIILADEVDGAPLPNGKGPFRIIVPGEKKPARSLWEVRTLIVRFGKDD